MLAYFTIIMVLVTGILVPLIWHCAPHAVRRRDALAALAFMLCVYAVGICGFVACGYLGLLGWSAINSL